ncbi:MAG: sugar transferase [Acidobacteriaceae bacterium]
MVPDNRTRLPVIGILKVFDLVLIILSFGFATAFVVHAEEAVSLSSFLDMRMKVANLVIFGVALLACHCIFRLCGLYESRRLSSKSAEILDIVGATTLSALCFFAIGSIFSVRMITLDLVLMFWVASTIVFSIFRVVLRSALAGIRAHGRNQRFMMIMGTNPRAVEFGRRITTNKGRGYKLVGFADDEWAGSDAFKKSGFSLVSNLANLAEYLRRNVVDEIVIYLPFGSFYRYFAEVSQICEQHGVTLRFSSDIFESKKGSWRPEESDGEYFISSQAGKGNGWPAFAKRTLDIIVALSLLVALLPVLSLAALAIKLSSPGPIFFLQERIGLNKRRFRIYKFRTMIPDAEKLMPTLISRNEASGPVFKIRNDPRITSIGRFLRRSSIDELPQLLNVLKGDMSLVGPRPLPVRDYEGFSQDWQRRRFSVKPGITCLWQVNGRSDIPFDEWMLLDLQYMDEWSLWLDFKILAKTVPAVFRGEGAA